METVDIIKLNMDFLSHTFCHFISHYLDFFFLVPLIISSFWHSIP